VWMLKMREELDLALEAFARGRVIVGDAQRLDRDVALVLEVRGEIDGRHRAVSERALRHVAACEGDLQLLEDEIFQTSSFMRVASGRNVSADVSAGQSESRKSASPSHDRRICSAHVQRSALGGQGTPLCLSDARETLT
jgi:hypothetical protein